MSYNERALARVLEMYRTGHINQSQVAGFLTQRIFQGDTPDELVRALPEELRASYRRWSRELPEDPDELYRRDDHTISAEVRIAYRVLREWALETGDSSK
jgi:hypothetical protein